MRRPSRKDWISLKSHAEVSRRNVSKFPGLSYLKPLGQYWVYAVPGLPKPRKAKTAFPRKADARWRLSRFFNTVGARYPSSVEYEVIRYCEKMLAK